MMHRLDAHAGEWLDRSAALRFTFEGREYQGYSGDTISSALAAAGAAVWFLAGGLTQVHPPGAGGTTALHVYVNFTAGAHGSILDPTSSPAATTEMQTEAIAFALTSGTALPVSVLAPVQ